MIAKDENTPTATPVAESKEEPATPYAAVTDGTQGENIVVMAPKSSHNCCGCCCDNRRAIIVVDSIGVFLASMTVLFWSTISSDSFADALDDDEVKTELAEIDQATVGTSIFLAFLGLFCYACGIYGALRFKQWAVIVAAGWCALEFIRSLLVLDVFGILMAGFFAYPHVVFVQEMKNGVMTEERYPDEARCCCCV